jgi:hypothetical protein
MAQDPGSMSRHESSKTSARQVRTYALNAAKFGWLGGRARLCRLQPPCMFLQRFCLCIVSLIEACTVLRAELTLNYSRLTDNNMQQSLLRIRFHAMQWRDRICLVRGSYCSCYGSSSQSHSDDVHAHEN